MTGLYCESDDWGRSYPSVNKALEKCRKDKFCRFVYDYNCDGKGRAILCSTVNSNFLMKGEDHCVYRKEMNDWIRE